MPKKHKNILVYQLLLYFLGSKIAKSVLHKNGMVFHYKRNFSSDKLF